MKKFTGERVVSSKDSLLFKLHFSRYQFASAYVKGKRVLDISCGSGYGSYYLSTSAKQVIGIDIDKETVLLCNEKYKNPNLSFLAGDGQQFFGGFKKKFDVITSFETLEHIDNYRKFLANIRAYLKPDGVLILSTPNNFRKIHPPTNKFHVREFDILDLHSLFKKIFRGSQIQLFGQCETNIETGSQSQKVRSRRELIETFYGLFFGLDLKYFGIFQKLEHLSIYKFLGNLQRDFIATEKIYRIKNLKSFHHPSTSIYVIKLRGNLQF